MHILDGDDLKQACLEAHIVGGQLWKQTEERVSGMFKHGGAMLEFSRAL